MTAGPARTTVGAIAELAGVERLTVYRHFPREDELFTACVTHGWERFPPPEYRAWVEIRDPEQRLRRALSELYAYYGAVGDGLLVIVRDFRHVPALAALNAPYFAQWDEMRSVLARGWNRRGRRRLALIAAIGHGLELSTWESFVRQQALSDEEAIALVVGMVRCA